jgi:hypothetical protein
MWLLHCLQAVLRVLISAEKHWLSTLIDPVVTAQEEND